MPLPPLPFPLGICPDADAAAAADDPITNKESFNLVLVKAWSAEQSNLPLDTGLSGAFALDEEAAVADAPPDAMPALPLAVAAAFVESFCWVRGIKFGFKLG